MWAAVLGAWALLLVVLAVVTQGDPTVAQQQTAAAARPSVDRVLAGALKLAGDDVVTAVGPYQRVGTCTLSATRSGVAYTRTADVYGRSGDTQRLLDRFLTGLPKADNPRRLVSTDGPMVGADPPNSLVKLSVRGVGADSDGHVLVTVNTGCRPASSHPHPEFLVPPTTAERAVPQSVAQALGVEPARWQRTVLTCAGGTYTTVTAQAPDDGGTPLDQRQERPGHDDVDPNGGTVLNTSATRLVERQADGTGLVVQLTHGQLRVEATTPCQ